MAIATVRFVETPSPRNTAAASGSRVPPRVYSPFAARRLSRPMAIPAVASPVEATGGGTRWSVFRGRRDTPTRDRSV